MKKVLMTAALFMVGVTGVYAQTFTTGYSSLVVFSDGHSSRPVGATEADCEANMERIIDNYLSMTDGSVVVDESRSLPCGPRSSTLPTEDLHAWNRLPVPPVCLSCPLLGPDTFEIYYPDFESKIKTLYHEFKIDQYNQELFDLQQNYDLKSFEAEVFMLNQDINAIKN